MRLGDPVYVVVGRSKYVATVIEAVVVAVDPQNGRVAYFDDSGLGGVCEGAAAFASKGAAEAHRLTITGG